MVKKILSSILATVAIVTLTGCSMTERDLIDKTYEINTPPRTIFLGDSIAAGYGLDGYTSTDNYSCPDSYANILKAKYTEEMAEIGTHEMQNFAVSGATSADLIELLNSGKLDSALAETDAVVVSIGGNDLLGHIFPIIESLGITLENTEINFDDIDIFSLLSQVGTLEQNVADSLVQFEINLNKIAHILDDKTEGNIYFQTLYNPLEVFTDISVVVDFSEESLGEFNRIITENSADSYKIIDVAGQFDNKCDTLTRIGEFDIHPNEAGHKVIADTVDKALTAETYTYTTQVYGEPHLTITAIVLIAVGFIAMLIVVIVIIPKLFKKHE